MIRLATEKDIDSIAKTYYDLLTYEKEHGSNSNWQLDIYPTIKVPQAKVPTNTMYVLEENNEICASMVLNNDQADEYKDVEWLYSALENEVLVIHTLCIPPQKTHKGYGKKMLQYAKDFAKEHDMKVIRIDTYVHNEPAKSLYLNNGFRIAGYGEILLQGLIQEDQVYLECLL